MAKTTKKKGKAKKAANKQPTGKFTVLAFGCTNTPMQTAKDYNDKYYKDRQMSCPEGMYGPYDTLADAQAAASALPGNYQDTSVLIVEAKSIGRTPETPDLAFTAV